MHMKIFSLKKINRKLKKMRSEKKVLSLRQRNDENVSCKGNNKIRKNLQETFVNEDIPTSGDELKSDPEINEEVKCIGTNVLSRVNFSNSRKAIVSGAEKIGKTFRGVRSTFGKISQRLQFGSRRRQRLSENVSPCRTPITPQARCRQLLGRTPTKLYSPFGIETPRYITDMEHNINPDTPDHITSPRKKRKTGVSFKFMKNRHPRSLFH